MLVQTLDCTLLQQKKLQLKVIRLDSIHPIVSGNKIFKLRYFLDGVTNKKIITFGGAYSNHLVAAAFACKQKSLRCVGIVRGEQPKKLSHTLQHCIGYGMELKFISRADYDKKDATNFIDDLKNLYGDCIIIPEGGYDIKGAKGAAAIMDHIDNTATHICCATGTATTIAGLLLQVKPHQQIIGFPVLKGMEDIEQRLAFLTGGKFDPQQIRIINDYHFGGYAKKNEQLIAFMNALYNDHRLPTDFVYTGKMMFGVMDMIEKDLFPPGSAIYAVHTGGLQGNLSLPKNTLTF
jgi:1-aminocyclopropane-1-carboxylate deaminase